MATITIGILAHVDAGKTSLTENILFTTGVIGTVGSVDKGTTQTDTMEMERARGITIKSAVVSFRVDDLTVNLIDTPGHADFVAEVERSLRVLDAVVLVISAVEGVQPQTRRLTRAIRAANLPFIIFVNKIDRVGARGETLLDDIRRKLQIRIAPMCAAIGQGERSATVHLRDRDAPSWRDEMTDLLAETNERVIEEYERTGGNVGRNFLEAELRAQVAAGDVVPVYTGSAILGVGVSELLHGVREWLPPVSGESEAAGSGRVFKITRRGSGEKVAYARIDSGRLSVRTRITLLRRHGPGDLVEIEERITGIDRFTGGTATPVDSAGAGEIVCLRGLKGARIGDRFGPANERLEEADLAFAAPALESIVSPDDPAHISRLRAALEQLAEQDPLISLRQRTDEGEPSVRLYGEVQKEVIADTLAREYGVPVHFGPTRTICIERVIGTGEAAELISDDGNPFYATLAFRIDPGPIGSGVRYHRELGSLPLAFYRATEETVYETLAQGLFGWEVTDCAVTLVRTGFASPVSTAADFRKLAPLVLMQALAQAQTVVCEPIERMELEIPSDTYGAVGGALLNARAVLRTSLATDSTTQLICDIPTAELRGLEAILPGLTRGDAGWESKFDGYQPITGEPPVRPRVGPDPRNRAEYLAVIARS